MTNWTSGFTPSDSEILEPGFAGGNSGASQTLLITNGRVQDFTLTDNTAFTLPDAPPSVTQWELTLRLTQDSTGGRLPTFITASGDTLKWDYGAAPSTNTFHTNPTQVNILKFEAAGDIITARFLNPKDSGNIFSGGAYLQQAVRSFIGDTTVTRRLPMDEVYVETITASASTATLFTVPMPLNTIKHVHLDVTGLLYSTVSASSATEGFSGEIAAYFRRSGAGNVAKVATETNIFSAEDMAGSPSFDATIDTTNQLGIIRIIPVTASMSWTGYGRVSGQTL